MRLGFLAAGFLFGLIAKLLLRRNVRLTWAASALAGLAGAGIGTSVHAWFSGTDSFQLSIRSVTAAAVGAVLVLTVYADIVLRSGSRRSVPVSQILASGESAIVEFKQTARHNTHTGERDQRMEQAVAKTVAGFANSEGGTLLIGVSDSEEIVGLDDDLRHMKRPDIDRYALWLTDLLETTLGRPALESISMQFPVVESRVIARVDVRRHHGPVFLRPPGGGRVAEMYVRTGNSTRLLHTDEAIGYVARNWSTWRRLFHA